MITHISLVTLWVTDQDAARDFYTDLLGFEVQTDQTLGDGFRWLTIAHPDQPEVQVTLMKPGPPADPALSDAIERSLANGTMSGFGVATDDCRKTYEELSAKGVTFVQPPSERPYGVEAVMRDNSGNWLVLVEQRAYDGGDFPHA
ncbi:catechol 2,3-dioxygenase-like lactoylglutathione lyase family enzyme [Mumia flava]|uniref:Catechol 2,3-dioxygenase-like lactoylglutathione lyase family enzyme n=1 Tax=Mumia flava TaxID=1348852 RepID=A0A0B2BPQ0_9ACTN|nr:VOC family protein [Mumia flava]PJJ56504.1 catechol 2,3-dioxygenase-like lactoylglutathione lyase family enzyme [Mumia flava]